MPEIDPKPPVRLHVGCGRARLQGWVNVDAQPLPGVDLVTDVTRGLGFSNVEAIFAEHFLEHLTLSDALLFLAEAHRALIPGRWIRLSTPNLDWVWSTHYRFDHDPEVKRQGALAINRAFRGWRHQFLWNRELLEEALVSCGFDEVRWCRYGESALPVFQGIERHETYHDTSDLPHVLVVEARKGEPRPERLAALHERVRTEILDHLKE
jgi:predicted SAM-dependent methyltransferase